MKYAREFKGKPNWTAIVMQSALYGDVGNVYRATQTADGQKALTSHLAIEFIERGNFEALKIVMPHLSSKHYRKTLNYCALNRHTKELEVCLLRANSDDVYSATLGVLCGHHHAAWPMIVEHLTQYTYNRTQRSELIEDAARQVNQHGMQELLALYPQSASTIYKKAVEEAISSKSFEVLDMLLPSLQRFTPQHVARALECAIKYNATAIPYILQHTVDPEFDNIDVREIVVSRQVTAQSLAQVLPYWNTELMDEACRCVNEKSPIYDLLHSHRQKQILLEHTKGGVGRGRKM